MRRGELIVFFHAADMSLQKRPGDEKEVCNDVI